MPLTLIYSYLVCASGVYAQSANILLAPQLKPLQLESTVGVGPDCASSKIITVAKLQDIVYCNTITNNSDQALTLEALVDTQGLIANDLSFELRAGDRIFHTHGGHVNITTRNTTMITARSGDGATETDNDTTIINVKNN